MTAPRRYELTDAEWDQIRKYVPEREAGQKGRPRNDDRQMLNGTLWIARSGASWRDLPDRYGALNTVYSRFVKWQREGLFQRILDDLGLDADLQDMSLDSTCVKAHQHSAGAKKGL
jgi:transposase